ncbi:Subtilisin-like protease SBT2.5 [Linum perenne]
MASVPAFIFFVSLVVVFSPVESKVFMILMEEDPVWSVMSNTSHPRIEEVAMAYKQRLTINHDIFLESVLKHNYTKLYSFTHLLNGFAIHVESDEVINSLKSATGVRSVHEDIKMQKLTTHTPDFLGIPNGVWPSLGGAGNAGDGVVIGLIDTGINPLHPSFATGSSSRFNSTTKFKGKCVTGARFPKSYCNGKIVGARYFTRAATAAGDFNATRDFMSPFDADGHGRQVRHITDFQPHC